MANPAVPHGFELDIILPEGRRAPEVFWTRTFSLVDGEPHTERLLIVLPAKMPCEFVLDGFSITRHKKVELESPRHPALRITGFASLQMMHGLTEQAKFLDAARSEAFAIQILPDEPFVVYAHGRRLACHLGLKGGQR